MDPKEQKTGQSPPFPSPTYRFDQKNEMFKRPLWDETMRPYGERFYREAEFGDEVGFRQIDYALRFGAWGLEYNAGFGVLGGNSGLYSWDGVAPRMRHWLEAGSPVEEPPEEMSRIVKKVARYFGADLVGICRLYPNWVYSHEFNGNTREHFPIEIPAGCDSAIVMAIAEDYQTIRMSPSSMEEAAVGLGYSKMAYLANLLATFIRFMGYRAIPCGNDTALSIPLAMAAGLGEFGRLGLLITKEFGPRVRLCKVFTDLPLSYDAYQPFGAKEFCQVCQKCATNCPAQAIPDGDMTREGHNISNHSGILKWYVDCEKCFQWWARIRMGCGNCVQVCPFNKPAGVIHDVARSVIRQKVPFLNRFLVWLDTLLGYDKRISPERFWKS